MLPDCLHAIVAQLEPFKIYHNNLHVYHVPLVVINQQQVNLHVLIVNQDAHPMQRLQHHAVHAVLVVYKRHLVLLHV